MGEVGDVGEVGEFGEFGERGESSALCCVAAPAVSMLGSAPASNSIWIIKKLDNQKK